ncbi:LuxR C-terminal-related transcriptional regulator [Streptomyces sp. NPDC050508]|uniref:response regulator transcription factor n=1 Tax=Streptomyces sp. NPDC050508 TaxID=3155405 RepID=UPI0034233E56
MRPARGQPVLTPGSPGNCWNGTCGPAGTPRPPCRTEELTPAERDVLRLLGTGLSHTEIADQPYPGAGTVKAHISRILTRTACDR